MLYTSKTTRQTGFTLVELLIVVIILAILAAIVVPQFSATTDDARQSAFDSNLASLRAVAELYRQQHGAYPGNVAATAAVCPTGANQTGAAGTASFPLQLVNFTNSSGQACTGFDATQFRFGPYLKEGIPENPLGTSNTVTVVSTGVLGLSTGSTGGWRFDSITGEIIGDQ
ncbi:MAG: type II secretion system GspH family protein [Gammaproteobacteria bacterium]|nr:type II secretion system GspH family protein [Gammaproteobacteria bacterium]